MPRKPLIQHSQFPFHVCARVNNREPFPLDLQQVWEILCHYCYEATWIFGAQIHAFVVMPNHFHLLLTSSELSIGEVMREFMRSATKTMNQVSGRSGRIFGSKYFGSMIDSQIYFAHALKYVYRNPVKANLSPRGVEHYSFSTLQGLLGKKKSDFPLYYPFQQTLFFMIPNEIESLLYWLNQPFGNENEAMIRKSFRHPVFSPPKTGQKGRAKKLLSRLL